MTLASCGVGDAEDHAGARVRVVVPGAVYAGASVQFSELHGIDSLGVRAVLDLDREHWGEPDGRVARDWGIARRYGMRFVHLPLHPVLPPSLAELEWAVAILEDSGTRPILVHADRGEERTGMVIAAYRIGVQGWSAERAYAEMVPDGGHDPRFAPWRERLFEFAAARRSRMPLDQSPSEPSPPTSVAVVDDRRPPGALSP